MYENLPDLISILEYSGMVMGSIGANIEEDKACGAYDP